jgi:hypothetical protein
MRAGLTAASRHQHLVLYDPAAIPADTPVDPDLEAEDPRLLPAPAMMQLASGGHALVLHIPEEDCEARFGLFVDEEPPEVLRSRGEVVAAGARLRVPSGLLRADGLEFLCRPGENRPRYDPEEAAIPAGVYAMDVISLLRYKTAGRIAEGRRGIGRGHRIVHGLAMVYLWIAILTMAANFLVAPMVVAWFWKRGGWPGAAKAVAAILAMDAVILGGFHLLDALKKRHPDLFRVMDADAAFEAAHPDMVVVLRTSGDGDTPSAPAYAEARAAEVT